MGFISAADIVNDNCTSNSCTEQQVTDRLLLCGARGLVLQNERDCGVGEEAMSAEMGWGAVVPNGHHDHR